MEPKLDPLPARRASSREQVRRMQDDYPDFYDRPRRRMPPMIAAGFAFVAAATVFYGAEMVLPPEYKPSHFIGSYEQAIVSAQAKGRAEGELTTRIVYDRKLKMLETTANALVEGCRAEFQRSNNLYQAVWARAGAAFQLASDLQRQYASVRYGVTTQTLGGEIGMANMSSTLGYLVALADPESGQKMLEYSEDMRRKALAKIDEASRNGEGVDFANWSQGLPDPGTLKPMPSCNLPASLGK